MYNKYDGFCFLLFSDGAWSRLSAMPHSSPSHGMNIFSYILLFLLFIPERTLYKANLIKNSDIEPSTLTTNLNIHKNVKPFGIIFRIFAT